MQRIRTGDTVEVIAGKDKGERGEVLRVDNKTTRLVVERVNIAKKHQKPQPNVRQAGIIEFEAPIHASNVMLVCPQCSQKARVGFRINEEGRKVRVCKKCKQDIG